jgi:uncharacterized membrane protein YbaN (DUF454 family)
MTEAKQVYSVKKILLFAFGGGIIVFGLAGLIIPVLPGMPLIFIGLSCCAKGSKSFEGWRPVKRVLLYAKTHYPKICL